MYDARDLPRTPEGGKYGGPVGDIQAVKAETRTRQKASQARLLQAYVIIGIEVVEPNDLGPLVQ
jgi:hypothetical protein